MTKIKKIIATITIASFLFSTAAPAVVHAEMWGTNIASSIMKQALEQVFLVLRKTILQTLKKEANKMIKKAIEKAISGSSSSSSEPSVVADYEDFIFGAAQREAEKTVDDFFGTLQQGVTNQERQALRAIEQTIRKQVTPETPKSTMGEIIDSDNPIEDIFKQQKGGGVGALIAYQFGQYNNSTNTYINARDAVEAAADQKKEAQQTKVIAGAGFNTIVDGNKVIPGKVAQEIVSAAEKMPIEMINNASSLEEVVANFVVSSMTSFIKNGINVVSKPMNAEQKKIINRLGDQGIEKMKDKIKQGKTTY